MVRVFAVPQFATYSLLVGVFLFGCGQQSQRNGPLVVKPVAENPFCSFQFIREPSEPLADDLDVYAGETFDVRVVVNPRRDFPQTLQERLVKNPLQWEVQIAGYPAGSNADADNAVRFACDPWYRSRDPELTQAFFFSPGPHYPTGPAASGPRALPFDHPSLILGKESTGVSYLRKAHGKNCWEHWALMGAIFTEPGEYVYEIRLLPAWYQEFNGVSECTLPGPPVVLRRGVLRVHAESEPR